MLTRAVSTAALAGAAVLFAGLLVSYGARGDDRVAACSIRTRKPVDGLAVFTKAVELLGLLAATSLLLQRPPAPLLTFSRPKGTLA